MKKVKFKNVSGSTLTVDRRTSMSQSRSIGTDWTFTEYAKLWPRGGSHRFTVDPSLNLPPARAKEVEGLLYYFEEKGLSVVDVQVRGGVCSVVLEDLRPKFFNKVVLPELWRYSEKAQRRVTYRFRTFRKAPQRRVSVHLELWLKDKRVEVVRFPVS